MFFRRHVAQHRRAVPADDGRAEAGGDVIVAGREDGGERPERVERRLVTLAEFFKVRVKEIFLVMGETPLRENGAAAGYDAGHAARRERNVAQQHTGVDREVVDALFALLDQGVAINFPGELFGLAVDFLERLINRHGTDGHGRVAQDPFARLVDVLAGGKVHQRVAAPARRPHNLLDLLLDRGSDGRVADVGVDLHSEIAADDHRLQFRVIDVGGDDRATACDLVAHELGRDLVGNARAEAHAAMLFEQTRITRVAAQLGELYVLTDRDVVHLGCDDALPRVMHLRDVLTGQRAPRLADVREPQRAERGVVFAFAPVFRAALAQFLRILPLQTPRQAQRRRAAQQ